MPDMARLRILHAGLVRAASALALAIPLLMTATGCETIAYYGQAIGGHAELMAKTRDIQAVLEDGDVSPARARRLQQVLAIRDFASRELGLPDNGSYRSYAEIERKAVVWSLVATAEFWVEPLQWCYPVIGCASYRGYFDREDARSAADKLRRQGRDVVVEPVAAYSTLGWFDDPLPSTLLEWPDPLLAGLIFHELAHQQLYVAGDSAFNEAFATAVETAGVRRWLSMRGDAQALADWEEAQRRKGQFIQLLLHTRQRLMELYRQRLGPEELRAGKKSEFDRLRDAYAELERSWAEGANFDGWFERPLNNARLASIGTYRLWAGAFERLLCEQGGDMQALYVAAQALGDLPDEPRQARLRELADQANRRNCM